LHVHLLLSELAFAILHSAGLKGDSVFEALSRAQAQIASFARFDAGCAPGEPSEIAI